MRAATSMFLISFANILPRRASMTAFLCLVVAHLEWPDIQLFLPSACTIWSTKYRWMRSVSPDLGMERRRQQRTLPDRDDPTRGLARLHAAEHLDGRADLLDPRGADEDRVHRPAYAGHGEVALERVDLAPEGVAPHRDVEPAEGLLVGDAVEHPVGEQDHARRRCRTPACRRRSASAAARTARTFGPASPSWSTPRPGRTSPSHASSSAGRRTASARTPRSTERAQVLADVALEGEHADRGSGHGTIVGSDETHRPSGTNRSCCRLSVEATTPREGASSWSTSASS